MSPLDSRSNFHLSNVGLCVWLFSWQLAICNKKKNLQRQQLKLSKIIFTYPANTYWKHVWYDKWKHLIIYLKVIDLGQGRQLQITTFQITFLIQIIFFEKMYVYESVYVLKYKSQLLLQKKYFRPFLLISRLLSHNYDLNFRYSEIIISLLQRVELKLRVIIWNNGISDSFLRQITWK